MQRDDLPLLAWQPPRQVIPFPARRRGGHARKVACQLAKARTNREADWVLHRALSSAHDQLVKAGIEGPDAEAEVSDLRELIRLHCISIDARWVPCHDESSRGGAA